MTANIVWFGDDGMYVLAIILCFAMYGIAKAIIAIRTSPSFEPTQREKTVSFAVGIAVVLAVWFIWGHVVTAEATHPSGNPFDDFSGQNKFEDFGSGKAYEGFRGE